MSSDSMNFTMITMMTIQAAAPEAQDAHLIQVPSLVAHKKYVGRSTILRMS